MSIVSNNQKVIEVISKFGMLNYLQGLVASKIKRIALYRTFPITSAPNWSDKREILLVQNADALVKILGNKNNLN